MAATEIPLGYRSDLSAWAACEDSTVSEDNIKGVEERLLVVFSFSEKHI